MTKFVRSSADLDFQVWLECQERLNDDNAMSPQMAADIAYWALKQAGYKDLAFELWNRMYEYEVAKHN